MLLSALGFGVMPIFALYAYRGGINTITLLALRFLLTAAMFFTYIFAKGIKIKITKDYLIAVILLGGVFYTAMSFSYFTAIKHISPSLGSLLLYTYPIFVSLLTFIFEKQRLSKRLIFSMLLSLVGLMLVLYDGLGKVSFLGIALMLFASLVYSCYIVYGNRVVRQHSSVITSGFVALFSAVVLGAYGLVAQLISFSFKPTTWASILGIVFFSTILAILAFFKGIELIGAARASIISMIEPLFTILLTTILFSEVMSITQWIGALAVLGGAMIVVMGKEKQQQQEPDPELLESQAEGMTNNE